MSPEAKVRKAGAAWHQAKERERGCAAALYLAMQEAAEAGMPETQIAKAAGVDRMTVRRALGKL